MTAMKTSTLLAAGVMWDSLRLTSTLILHSTTNSSSTSVLEKPSVRKRSVEAVLGYKKCLRHSGNAEQVNELSAVQVVFWQTYSLPWISTTLINCCSGPTTGRLVTNIAMTFTIHWLIDYPVVDNARFRFNFSRNSCFRLFSACRFRSYCSAISIVAVKVSVTNY